MEGEDLQEMVMERDGKFEVLSSVDLQAEQPGLEPVPHRTRQETSVEEVATSQASRDDISQVNAQCASVENLNTVGGEAEENKVTGEQSQPTDEVSKGAEANKVTSEQLQPTDEVTKGGRLSEIAANLSDNTEDQVRFSEPTNQPDSGSIDTPSNTELVPMKLLQSAVEIGHVKPVQQIRLQSAPGPRSTRASRRQKEEEEEQQRRQQLSDAAFKAWVSRKNNELTEKRKCERAKLENTEDDVQKKRETCDLAYKNWLETKKREWQQQRAVSRPSTSVPKKDEAKCRQAFESWMNKKQTQHLEEVRREQMKTREMKELAEKADPSVIDRAYKEWLQHKRSQAREEAAKKEHYRKLYFSQPRKLKEYMTESICFSPKKDHPKKVKEFTSKRFDGF